MKPWFKFYGGEYLSDPKMLELTACERSCWITLLSYASQGEGMIKHLPEHRLLSQSGLDPLRPEWKETEGILEKFVTLSMITHDNGLITVLNWQKRQETSLTPYERVKRHRERKRADNDNDNRRVEESRVEKSRDVEDTAPTPSQIAKLFFDGKEPYGEYLALFSKDKNRGMVENEFRKFILYWTEPNKSGTKVRWQQQSTFDVKRRLFTWMSNVKQFNNKGNKGEPNFVL